MSKKCSVGLVQINNGFSNQYYLPYSVGLLQAYVEANAKNPNKYQFQIPIYKRLSLSQCLEYLKPVDVVLISLYVWNEQISLAVAKEIKNTDPEKLIVVGGPSVPDDALLFMEQNPWIDVAVHQEGEVACLEILEQWPNSDFSSVLGVDYRSDGTVITTDVRPRMKEFSTVPSPYLNGVFDKLIYEVKDEHKWLASWETNRGCPFACTYCDWGSATNNKVSRIELDRAFQELEWFSSHEIEFVFTCDANFGMLARDIDIVDYAVDLHKRTGYPKVLSVQNTKNNKDRSYQVQKKLVQGGLAKSVSLALQTTSGEVLKAIKRDNIRSSDYMYLQNQFREDGISTYTEIILALPGETYDSFADGVDHVISNGQHNKIQFNNLSILPNAEMARPDYVISYGIETVESPIVNMHGSLDIIYEDGITEKQKLVVSTASLPVKDWKKVRIYASFTELLYFCKVLQIPMLYLNVEHGVSYRQLIEIFMSVTDKCSVIGKVNHLFMSHAEDMIKGEAEFIYSQEWLNIYWPPGEYAYIHLSINGLLADFYKESYELLNSFVSTKEHKKILKEALKYNQFRVNQPNTESFVYISLEYPINDWYKEWLYGKKVELQIKPTQLQLDTHREQFDDWQDWMQQVVWYGHRTGAYMFGEQRVEKDIAGHY